MTILSLIYEKLEQLVKQKRITSENNIYVYGYTNNSRAMIYFLHKYNIFVKAVFDKNISGKGVCETPIGKPEEYLKEYDMNAIILIASQHTKSMRDTIIGINGKYKEAIIVIEDYKNVFYEWQEDFCNPTEYYDYLENLYERYIVKEMPTCAKTLQCNERLKGIHKGERCFILGNGPSVKKLDFSLLENEIIFGANQIMDAPFWNDINVKYWTCTDGDFFGLWSTSEGAEKRAKLYSEKIKSLKMDVDEIFVMYDYKSYMEYYGFDKDFSINYIYPILYGDVHKEKKLKREYIDLSKTLVEVASVVIYNIQIALYMGFSEIYLLGCDQTLLYYAMKKKIEGIEEHTHFVDAKEDVSMSLNKEREESSEGLGRLMWDTYLVQMQFRMFGDLCRNSGVRLINLTEGSLVEGIEKKKIEEIICK